MDLDHNRMPAKQTKAVHLDASKKVKMAQMRQAQGLNEKHQYRAERQPVVQQDKGLDFILGSKMSWYYVFIPVSRRLQEKQ